MAEEASNTSNSTQQQGGTGTQTGAEQAQSQQSGSGNSNSRTFTQAEVDEIIKERLQREKSKADKAAEDARRAAEAEAAAGGGSLCPVPASRYLRRQYARTGTAGHRQSLGRGSGLLSRRR